MPFCTTFGRGLKCGIGTSVGCRKRCQKIEIYKVWDVGTAPFSVSIEELRLAVRSCGNNKASGIDFIPSELFKILVTENEINSFTAFGE